MKFATLSCVILAAALIVGKASGAEVITTCRFSDDKCQVAIDCVSKSIAEQFADDDVDKAKDCAALGKRAKFGRCQVWDNTNFATVVCGAEAADANDAIPDCDGTHETECACSHCTHWGDPECKSAGECILNLYNMSQYDVDRCDEIDLYGESGECLAENGDKQNANMDSNTRAFL